MGLFGSKSELVSMWQKIKKDGEKARGGKKPGGKMGFEEAITRLDKAMKSKDPDLEDIQDQLTELSRKMTAYAADLDPQAERVFIAGIKSYTKMLAELSAVANDAFKNQAEEGKVVVAAKLQMGRIIKLTDAMVARMDMIKKDIDGIDFSDRNMGGMDAINRLKEATKQLDQLDKEIQALGRERDKQFNIIMRNVGA